MKVPSTLLLLLFVTENVLGIVDNCYLFHMNHGCKSVDVRYNQRNLQILKQCSRIYGNLKIANLHLEEEYKIENGNTTEIVKNHFPELVEITGFLRIDNVTGLKSLGKLFSNLTVIHGESLWFNDSIVITNCPDLESFGFNSLLYAGKNKGVEITHAKVEGCSKIAADSSITFTAVKSCEYCSCTKTPEIQNDTTSISLTLKPDKPCCNENCMGGCDHIHKCIACQQKLFKKNETDRIDCENLEKDDENRLNVNGKFHVDYNTCKMYNGFRQKQYCFPRKSCRPCKHCDSIYIEKKEDIDNLKDQKCESIGDIVILNLTVPVDYDLEGTLYKFLSNVTEIRYCIIIKDSPAIKDFRFFPSVNTLSGGCKVENSDNSCYAMILDNNPNLEALFPKESQVVMAGGGMMISNNEKLCSSSNPLSSIQQLDDLKSMNNNTFASCATEMEKELWSRAFVSNDTVIFEVDATIADFERTTFVIEYRVIGRNSTGTMNQTNDNVVEPIENLQETDVNLVTAETNSTLSTVIEDIKSSLDDQTYASESDEIESTEYLTESTEYLTESTENLTETADNEPETTETSKITFIQKRYANTFYGTSDNDERSDKETTTNDSSAITTSTENPPENNEATTENSTKSQDQISVFVTRIEFDSSSLIIDNLSQGTTLKYQIFAIDKASNKTTKTWSKYLTTLNHSNPNSTLPLYLYNTNKSIHVLYANPDQMMYNKWQGDEELPEVIWDGEQRIKEPEKSKLPDVLKLLSAIVVILLMSGVYVFIELRPPPAPADPDKALMKSFNFKMNNIKIYDLIGGGEFGDVKKGKIVKTEQQIAIKSMKEGATPVQRLNFAREVRYMVKLRSFHVVECIGFVLAQDYHLVLMELMEYGDLKSFLQNNKPIDTRAATSDYAPANPNLAKLPIRLVESMAIEIADGMAYLENEGYLHCDLAARNCMISGDFTVKVGDFGMTRKVYTSDYYQLSMEKRMPLRWMAPETFTNAIDSRRFTSKSDVFSFGIVLYEMATFGDDPYPKIPSEIIVDFVGRGGKMDRPEGCSDMVHELMQRCWEFKPDDRISFIDAVELLIDHAPEGFRDKSFYHTQMKREVFVVHED